MLHAETCVALNEKVGNITWIRELPQVRVFKAHAQDRPLTSPLRFKFQTASHEFSLTFFRALHCSQTEHAHKRLSIPHADTVTEAGRQKFARL